MIQAVIFDLDGVLIDSEPVWEQVAHGKPAPDIYQAVAAQLGHPAAQCAAIEDSSNGLRSAAAAGLHVIAIPHPKYPPDPDALSSPPSSSPPSTP